MVCVPGKIRTRLSPDSYYRSRAGFASAEAWNRRRVECDACGTQLSASSLASHLETQHGIFRSKVISRDLLVDGPERTYHAYISAYGVWHCPVPGCVGSAKSKWKLRRHFYDRYPSGLVSIPGEGVYPRCADCGMQIMNPSTASISHRSTELCRVGTERKEQREAAIASVKALDTTFTFTAYDEELELFKYLGRLLAMDDNDMQAVRANLARAGGCCHGYCGRRISRREYVVCSTRRWCRRFCCTGAKLGL